MGSKVMGEKYICKTCGHEFGEIEIITLSYQEYQGASVQHEHVSPCCHGNYEVLQPQEQHHDQS